MRMPHQKLLPKTQWEKMVGEKRSWHSEYCVAPIALLKTLREQNPMEKKLTKGKRVQQLIKSSGLVCDSSGSQSWVILLIVCSP
jgi:hypothetical protein